MVGWVEPRRQSTNSCPSMAMAEPPIAWGGVMLVFLTPALGGLIYGFDIGATSVVILMLLFQQGGSTLHLHHAAASAANYRYHHMEQSQSQLQPSLFDSWWTDPNVAFAESTWQQGLVVAAVSLGAMAGSHVSFCYSEQMGRRMELRLAAVLYILGAVANVLSGTVLRYHGFQSLALLIGGRFIFGAGVGFVMHGAPTYLAEMMPTSIRGAVVSAKETVIVLGILIGYWAGDVCSRSIFRGGYDDSTGSTGNHLGDTLDDNHGGKWTRLYATSAFLALPMLALTFLIPRSMRWLLTHGHRDEAIESMRFVYRGDPNIVQEAFAHLEANMTSRNHGKSYVECSGMPLATDLETKPTHTISPVTLLQRLLSPSLRPSFRAAMGLIILQQFSGQPSVLSFSAVLFHAVGWNGRASIVTAFVMLCVSTTTVFTVDWLGRKRLLYICCSVLAVAASMLSYQFWDWPTGNERPTFSPTGKLVVLVAMFAFIGGYQIGFGPITWLVVSEVFPADVRGAATALGVELNYMLNFVVQFLVPIAKDRIGWGPTFGMYASVMVLGLSFVHLYVPETAGLSLEAIEEQMSNLNLQPDDANAKDVIDTGVTELSPLLEREGIRGKRDQLENA